MFVYNICVSFVILVAVGRRSLSAIRNRVGRVYEGSHLYNHPARIFSNGPSDGARFTEPYPGDAQKLQRNSVLENKTKSA